MILGPVLNSANTINYPLIIGLQLDPVIMTLWALLCSQFSIPITALSSNSYCLSFPEGCCERP